MLVAESECIATAKRDGSRTTVEPGTALSAGVLPAAAKPKDVQDLMQLDEVLKVSAQVRRVLAPTRACAPALCAMPHVFQRRASRPSGLQVGEWDRLHF